MGVFSNDIPKKHIIPPPVINKKKHKKHKKPLKGGDITNSYSLTNIKSLNGGANALVDNGFPDIKTLINETIFNYNVLKDYTLVDEAKKVNPITTSLTEYNNTTTDPISNDIERYSKIIKKEIEIIMAEKYPTQNAERQVNRYITTNLIGDIQTLYFAYLYNNYFLYLLYLNTKQNFLKTNSKIVGLSYGNEFEFKKNVATKPNWYPIAGFKDYIDQDNVIYNTQINPDQYSYYKFIKQYNKIMIILCEKAKIKLDEFLFNYQDVKYQFGKFNDLIKNYRLFINNKRSYPGADLVYQYKIAIPNSIKAVNETLKTNIKDAASFKLLEEYCDYIYDLRKIFYELTGSFEKIRNDEQKNGIFNILTSFTSADKAVNNDDIINETTIYSDNTTKVINPKFELLTPEKIEIYYNKDNPIYKIIYEENIDNIDEYIKQIENSTDEIPKKETVKKAKDLINKAYDNLKNFVKKLEDKSVTRILTNLDKVNFDNQSEQFFVATYNTGKDKREYNVRLLEGINVELVDGNTIKKRTINLYERNNYNNLSNPRIIETLDLDKAEFETTFNIIENDIKDKEKGELNDVIFLKLFRTIKSIYESIETSIPKDKNVDDIDNIIQKFNKTPPFTEDQLVLLLRENQIIISGTDFLDKKIIKYVKQCIFFNHLQSLISIKMYAFLGIEQSYNDSTKDSNMFLKLIQRYDNELKCDKLITQMIDKKRSAHTSFTDSEISDYKQFFLRIYDKYMDPVFANSNQHDRTLRKMYSNKDQTDTTFITAFKNNMRGCSGQFLRGLVINGSTSGGFFRVIIKSIIVLLGGLVVGFVGIVSSFTIIPLITLVVSIILTPNQINYIVRGGGTMAIKTKTAVTLFCKSIYNNIAEHFNKLIQSLIEKFVSFKKYITDAYDRIVNPVKLLNNLIDRVVRLSDIKYVINEYNNNPKRYFTRANFTDKDREDCLLK
jgi:hypothetical protein